MESLYEIDKKVANLLMDEFDEKYVDEETGEVNEELARQDLDALEMERNEKLENIALFIKNLNGEITLLKQEETALSTRRKAKENKVERLKQYVSNSMQTFGDLKIETPRVALSFRKSESVVVEDSSLLEPRYLKEKIEYSADKTLIKRELKAGNVVLGARLVENNNLQIK